MATMIPTEPYEYTRESHEGDIFRYFEKNLPKEYYVFHSVILDSFDEESNKFEEKQKKAINGIYSQNLCK